MSIFKFLVEKGNFIFLEHIIIHADVVDMTDSAEIENNQILYIFLFQTEVAKC